MTNLLFILLGIGIWQLVVALVVFSTDDEEKVFKIGIGIVGWFLYFIITTFATITKHCSHKDKGGC